ncbi:tRNA lysidine(34) synthetase TilS [Falsarthrobacter nasiphocae]|uniref:tRNA(Ile)-lysidine synthase n=1 Tax=Falsarthrobacter nasiphocae TaxID=189863 RepID=A0AAE3YEM3_9MICC|nr:tRNA lysidine(34) synthetase TilS [Falsarthrobacter nasiphocae]MDR6891989.1 tRNA(Ile)-lysidine synthase [Falsarthrobacter nasiphocae]
MRPGAAVFARALAAVRAALASLPSPAADDDGAERRPGTPPLEAVVAVSGGADSLALAAVVAALARRGEVEARAVVVDHGLQGDSAPVAARAAAACEGLGLEAEVRRVDVTASATAAHGLEAAARAARYVALADAASPRGVILTAHTLSDQAEQVLLGLIRGSGARSLAGIPRRTQWGRPGIGAVGPGGMGEAAVLRPFLDPRRGLWRADTELICRHAELTPWQDPTNGEPIRPRTQIRLEALPALEAVSEGVRANLARTAALMADDADFLDTAARDAYARVRRPGRRPGEAAIVVGPWRQLHPALQGRVTALAAQEAGAPPPTRERIEEINRLMRPREEDGTDSAGPVQAPGLRCWRRRMPGPGGKMEPTLVLERAEDGLDAADQES